MKKSNLMIVTLGRVDWNIWHPILKILKGNKNLKLIVCAAGMHFEKSLGESFNEIKKDKIHIDHRIKLDPLKKKGKEQLHIAKQYSFYTQKFTEIFEKDNIDYLALVGDRFESLAAAAASIPFRIPIFHFHGGEISFGSIDEINRHMITKASHIHFVSTNGYAKRVNQLGEEKWRIKNIGAPSLNNIKFRKSFSKEKFLKKYNFRVEKKLFIVNFNSESLNYDSTKKQINIIFKSLETFDVNILFTLTNHDYASSIINNQIKKYCRSRENCEWTSFLGENYFNVLKISNLMIGNSSSGIIEASHIKLPVINIGDRQKGRIKDQNVINVTYDINEIRKKIMFSQKQKFLNQIKNLKSSYSNKNFKNLNKFFNEYLKKDKKYLLNKIFYDL